MVNSTQCNQEGARIGSLANNSSSSSVCSSARRRPHCVPAVTLAVLLITAVSVCRSAPVVHEGPEVQLELQVLKQIDHVCSSLLSLEQQPQAPDSLEELCYLIMGGVRKSQGLKERENSKRFLFHYTKPQGSAPSDITSSVLHPLLQLVPQLHVRRPKRFTSDEDLQGPGGIQSRGYFLYRPRNGRSSAFVV
ncbi:neuromedin-U isoform X1 [Anguilla rostrata]|uniref:neuromedin-U isoform X2 n=1 Tax=Anguilla anguilla TaxID=7936 RepID=UPI0015AEA813|nr:neuromedin-U isoform X2 [Anguilla anguilla]